MATKVIKTLYEDAHILVINKPAGLMVHSDGRSHAHTLVNWIEKNHPEMNDVGEIFRFAEKKKEKLLARPGIVHRLDKDTSGVLILCKTHEAFRKLKAQFKEHSIKKVYRAIVWGHVKHDTGIIDAPIARSKSDFRARSVPDPFEDDTRGLERDAVTRYKVLERLYLGTGDNRLPLSYIELHPTTGRTHQLRVHCRSIRHPIVDDDLYGPVGKPVIVGRTGLHAFRITFSSPDSHAKKDITVEAPLPKDFIQGLARLQKM